MTRGWWKLNITWTDEDMDEHEFLTDMDREHIADYIKEGYKEGELIHHYKEGELIHEDES